MQVRVSCEAPDGDEIEGVIVAGHYDGEWRRGADVEGPEGWDIDGSFVVLTDDGERIRVNGWMGYVSVVPTVTA